MIALYLHNVSYEPHWWASIISTYCSNNKRCVLLERLCNSHALGCEVFTAVAKKSHIFWDTMPGCPLQVGRRFGGTSFHAGFCSTCSTLKMEVICASETSGTPYFVGWFLDIKIKQQSSYEYVPWGFSLNDVSWRWSCRFLAFTLTWLESSRFLRGCIWKPVSLPEDRNCDIVT
jgi:hypothetical protein